MADQRKSTSVNPFEGADYLNPFSQGIQEYNPFQNQPPQPPPLPQVHQPPVQQGQLHPSTTPPAPPPFGAPPSSTTVSGESNSAPVGSSAPSQPSDTLHDIPLDFPASASRDANRLVGEVEPMEREPNPASSENASPSFYQLAFWQRFFDIDTRDVVVRCLRSVLPFRRDFLDTIKQNADLYGPFWITTTLIFVMGAAGNFASALNFVPSNAQPTWHYDFAKLTWGVVVIYGYAFIVPLVFWAVMKWWMDIEVSFMQLLCIYGYALFIYIPVSLVCIAPFNWLRWVVLGVACGLSTAFLVLNLWVPLRHQIASALLVLLIIILLHVALAFVFRLYFFNFASSPSDVIVPSPTPPHTVGALSSL